MLFQDFSCVADVSFCDFKKKGLYAALQVDGSAILAVSHRYKVKIEGIDALNGLDPQLCQTFCHANREDIWAVPGAEAITGPESGIHAAVIHVHTQERFKVFVLFFRRAEPFSPAELSWAKSFIDLYYEKVLLFNNLSQTTEYMNHIFEGSEFPILIFNLAGELVSLNLFASELFQIQQPKEFRRYRQDNQRFFDMLHQAAQSDQKESDDNLIFTTENGAVPLNVSMSPIHNTKGIVVGVSVLLYSTTEESGTEKHPVPAVPHISMSAFGRFDVFADGRLVNISSSKAKELLALCIDHCGGDVTMEEAIDKLWEDRAYDKRSKNLYRKTVSYLHHLFESLGCPDIFVSARGRCHLNRELFDCDYFRYLEGQAVPFTGKYLSQYTWAEETSAWLHWRQSEQGPVHFKQDAAENM